MQVFGVDISVWQRGINMSKLVDEGVKFAIIRGGYTGSKDKKCYKDSEFETHYNNAKSNGLDVGAYYFSRAVTYNEGKEEAEFFYNNCLKGKNFEYPVCIDVEDNVYQQKSSKENVTEAIKGFCTTLEDKGYYVSVYCNLNWAKNYMNYSELKKLYDFWLAAWSATEPNRSTYKYGIWQFGGETNKLRSNTLAEMVVDQNYAYKDYPKMMKEIGFNGYKREEPTPIIDNNPISTEEPKTEPNEVVDDNTGNIENNSKDIELIKKNIIMKIIEFIIGLFRKK